jgi:predicted MPP superfamily phosphohydrolase
MKKLLINLSLLIIIVLFLFWVVIIEPNFIRKTYLEIGLQNISEEAKGLKIVQISDIHLKAFNTVPRKIAEELIRIKPDYLFITGDIINWDIKKLDDLKDFLAKLSSIENIKIFGVYGNHEHLSRKFDDINKIFLDSKIKFLNNETIILPEGINLVGLDDPHLKLSDLSVLEKIDKTFPSIILAHSPEVFRDITIENSLVLSGHTHGGQVNIPILVDQFLPLSRDRQYKSGLFYENNNYLYVNRGLGTTFLPIRLNSFPEITIFNLTEKK